MDKKHTIALVVIGLITLVVTIGAASFAYFASAVDVNQSVPIGASTAAQTAAFITSATGAIDIDVSAAKMQESNSNDTAAPDELTSRAVLSIYLSAAEDQKVSTCSYNIIYEWDQDSTEYIRTENVDKEFTISSKVLSVDNLPTLAVNDPNYRLFQMKSPELGEINFDELDWQYKNVTEGVGDAATTKQIRYAVLVENAIVSSLSKDTPTVVNYEFVVKFYNASRDQSVQMSKNFRGNIRVDSDSINC